MKMNSLLYRVQSFWDRYEQILSILTINIVKSTNFREYFTLLAAIRSYWKELELTLCVPVLSVLSKLLSASNVWDLWSQIAQPWGHMNLVYLASLSESEQTNTKDKHGSVCVCTSTCFCYLTGACLLRVLCCCWISSWASSRLRAFLVSTFFLLPFFTFTDNPPLSTG